MEERIIHIKGRLETYANTRTLVSAKELVLRQHQIKNLDFLDGSKTLESIEIYDNHIRFMETLRGFPKLRSLDLGFNMIEKLPFKIHEEGCLEELYLSANKISSIEGLKNLQHLRILELGCNFIERIGDLSYLKSLEELWAAANKISEFPILTNLSKLRIVSLQENRISTIESLPALEYLEELLLSHNKIAEIATDFSQLPSLRLLDLSNNPIMRLPHIKSTSLESIWLGGTRVSRIEDILVLAGIDSLKFIDIIGTPLALSADLTQLQSTFPNAKIKTGR